MTPALFDLRIGLHLHCVVVCLERVHKTHAETDAVVISTAHQPKFFLVGTEVLVKTVAADRVERSAVERRTLAHVIGIGQAENRGTALFVGHRIVFTLDVLNGSAQRALSKRSRGAEHETVEVISVL